MKKDSNALGAFAVVALIVAATVGLMACPPSPPPPAAAPPSSSSAPAPAKPDLAPPTPPPADAAPIAAPATAPTPAAPASAPTPAAPAAPAPATPAKPTDDRTGSGTISGVVTVTRVVPAPAGPPAPAGGCANPWLQDSLVVGPRGELEDVLVYLKGDLPPWTPTAGATFALDQKGCHYEPHVLVAPVGGTVQFKNSDTVLHNVKWSGVLNPSGNFAVPPNGSTDHSFAKPELLEVGCAVHSFMGGVVAVVENRFFAVTAADGTYSITGVPAGSYTLVAWHQVLKKAVRAGTPVTVAPGQAVTLDLRFD